MNGDFVFQFQPFGGSSSGSGGENRSFYLRRVRRRVPKQEVRHFRTVERVKSLDSSSSRRRANDATGGRRAAGNNARPLLKDRSSSFPS